MINFLFKQSKEYVDVNTKIKEIKAIMSIVGYKTYKRITSESNFNIIEDASL